MSRTVVFMILACLVNFAKAQDTESFTDELVDNPTKNIIYGNVEYYLLGGAANISYERYLFSAKKFDLAVRGTYGIWTMAGMAGADSGDLFKITGNMLFFKGSNHLELDLGATYLINNDSGIKNVVPDLFCGYAFKKPDGHFVIKAGIGFVGFVSLGLGYAF